jgi:hypothetical protein
MRYDRGWLWVGFGLAALLLLAGAALLIANLGAILGQSPWASLVVERLPPTVEERLIPTRTPVPPTTVEAAIVSPGAELSSPSLATAAASPSSSGPTVAAPTQPAVTLEVQPSPAIVSPTTAAPVVVTDTPQPAITPVPTAAAPTATSEPPRPSLYQPYQRFGVAASSLPLGQYDLSQLHAGWYLAWSAIQSPDLPQGSEFAQMIRISEDAYSPGPDVLDLVLASNPGSLWLIGNEPDCIWQDDVTPGRYAEVYHELYYFLKRRDPTCRIAIGGVSQPTPLRLQYLDAILNRYTELYGEKMPVDVWNAHNFMLREEKGSWGADIPPGIPATQGILYEIEDSGNLEAFRRQIVTFRRWMKEKGERDKPLIISEYGIPMPEDYGFPYERVRDFMYGTFDYFLTATDDSLGYPPDGNRLVQRWCWFSLADTGYPTGNLFDPATQQITPLGEAFGRYVASLQ